MKRIEMSLEAAIKIAEDYIHPGPKAQIHTYGEICEAISALVVNARKSIPAEKEEEPQLEGQMNIHDYGI